MATQRGKHHRPVTPVKVSMARRAAVVGALPIAFSVGAAGVSIAAPSQPGVVSPENEQPGVTTPTPSPEQPGVSTPPAAPNAVPLSDEQQEEQSQPGAIPDPPVLPQRQEPNYLRSAPEPSYPDSDYEPEPQAAPVAPVQEGPPVGPIAPPPATVRIGDFESPKPDWLPQDVANSTNRYAAYYEWQIATFYSNVGLPPQRTDRIAAGTIAGAAVGAAAAGIPAAVVGGLVGGTVGGLVGASFFLTPPLGPLWGPVGTAAGAAVGAAAAGIPAAVVGGVVGGAIGAAVSAGDPNAQPVDPPVPGQPAPAPRSDFDPKPYADAAVDTANKAVNWTKAQPGGQQLLDNAPANAESAITAAESHPTGKHALRALGDAGNQAAVWLEQQPNGRAIVSAAQQAGSEMPAPIVDLLRQGDTALHG